ncbi:DUF4410 domain-containing protein [Candidatus Poribacteria bacterium]|nr:DUF4410 domain-containing protein [Candidatus Poribacteria bacterium]
MRHNRKPQPPSAPASRVHLRLILAAVIGVLGLAQTGCSRYVRDTGYLADYSEFNAVNEDGFKMRVFGWEDFRFDKFFLTNQQKEQLEKREELPPDPAAEGLNLDDAQPVLFVVEQPEWRASAAFDPDVQEGIVFTIRERLYRYLLRQYPHPVRVRYAYLEDEPQTRGYRVITLRSAVTDVEDGAGALRFILGYGLGATVMQLEGSFIDHQNGDRVLGEFALRESHGGYPNGLMNPRVFSAPYCLKYTADEAIGKLTGRLREFIPAASPKPGTTAQTSHKPPQPAPIPAPRQDPRQESTHWHSAPPVRQIAWTLGPGRSIAFRGGE